MKITSEYEAVVDIELPAGIVFAGTITTISGEEAGKKELKLRAVSYTSAERAKEIILKAVENINRAVNEE